MMMHFELNDSDCPTTTAEYIEFYLKYINIWYDELSFSIDNLKQYLNNEEIELLTNSQNEWEAYIDAYMLFDNTVLQERRLYLGSQYNYSKLSHYMDLIRDRTLHIKYIIYLIEKCDNYYKGNQSNNYTLWDKYSINYDLQ